MEAQPALVNGRAAGQTANELESDVQKVVGNPGRARDCCV
jgi:hypothetical protein